MLWLFVEAPFAACRTFTAGWYRPTATFLTPSAAYGLVLNFAGINSRLLEGAEGHDGKTPASLTAKGLPGMKLAIGAAAVDRRGIPIAFEHAFPRVQSVYQQLHTYPVNKKNAAVPIETTKGNKNNITPVRREFLSDLRAVIGVDADDVTLNRIQRGLNGEFPRYGVPFLGDNNFLLDRADVSNEPRAAYWFTPVTEAGMGPQPRTARLTVQIDRADLSRTTSQLFAPCQTAEATPPVAAWTTILHS